MFFLKTPCKLGVR